MSDKQTTRFHGTKKPHLTAALLLVIFAAGALISWRAVVQADRDMRADLLQRTQIVVQAVNVEHIQALTGTEDDLEKPAYLRFKEQLATVRSASPQYRFVYLIGRNTDGALFFFVDSEPTGSKDYSPPGQVYDEAPEGYRRVFVTDNAATEGPYTDRWGTWVSALIPINDTQAAISDLASPDNAQVMVRNAVDFYRKNDRERFLKEINNPQGKFCKGDLYTFAYDQNITMLAHPVKPELVGQNLLDKKDWSGGKYFRREIQQIAQSKGSGWVDYEYENPTSKQRNPKTTYIESVDDLVICAGAYKVTGSVLAVLSMDIDARDWNWILARAALPPALLTLALAAILLTGSALLARRSRIAGPLPRRLRHLEPVLTAAVGLVLTIFAAYMIHEYETRDRNRAFALLAAGRAEAVAEILRDLRDIKLEGLSCFYEGSEQVTSEEFRQFTGYLTKNQTVQAWEWIPAVPAADKSHFEEAARADGLTGFEVWQKDAQGNRVPASGRTVYYPVLRIAPWAGNERALGYDLGSEPLRSVALEEAKRTGLATGADPITLVQTTGSQKGMLIYRPVFGGGEPRLLRGFTLAVLQMGTLMRSVVPDNSALMQISLLHKDTASELLAISWNADSPPTAVLSATRIVFAFGKVFGVTAHAGPEFMSLYPARLGWLVVLTGLALTAALTFVSSGIRRRREELEQLVAERTTELQEINIYLEEATARANHMAAVAEMASAAKMAMRAQEKGLELLCSADLDVPTMLRGDPGRLRQILNNLAGNAVKFTPAGEVAIRVSLEEDAGGREQGAGEQETVLLRFSVRDSGIGIPKDKIGLLFDKFSQVDTSTTRQYGGTGLGLAISKQLTELMNGEAGVNSEEGKGSEFWFTARLGKQTGDAYIENTLPADLHNVRVLIVDDNATNREILFTRMASWGMRPTEAMDGIGALQILYKAIDENDIFRIAVIDMQMPGMDGETLGKIIQVDKRMNDTRMVMLTSLGRRGDARRLEEIGFAGYANKPVRHQEFKAVLSLVLDDRNKSTQMPIATRYMARETLNLFAGSKARILLAEDNITNQQVALGILKKLGLRADAVANGAEALKALETLPYDLVLMDVQMPVMDGFEATKRIRKGERKMMNDEESATDDSHSSFILPIIAMTAHAMQVDRERCIEAGMNDYVTKPISPQALAEVLDKWLPQENDDRCAEVMKKNETEEDASRSSLIFDRAGLMARLMDDEDLARMLVEGFLEDIPKQIAALKGYLETGDVTGIERQAHTIRGVSANVGGERLREVAFEMEKAAKAGDLSAAGRHIPELEAQFNLLNQAMTKEL
jgi:CheY-like chemotaxis protein/CHASE1-domain containing sensor protein/HPt (histidine-containing phosphotransfer) domain-containing protein